jgi:hypothetical protein
MVTAKGYIIRGPKFLCNNQSNLKLVSGDSNNGEKTVLLGPASSFNLIGNPYPLPSI